MTTVPDTAARSRTVLVAVAALVLGAVAMAISPAFVRWAEVGPFTSAFYRVFLALPLLALWASLERGGDTRPDPGWTRAIVLTGLFFAGDLFFWHLSVLKTTIANATLLATMAPVWVMAFSSLFIGEPVTRPMLAGLALCVAGAGLLIGASSLLDPSRFVGDLYGVGTSLFFGLYFLAMRVARREARPGLVLYRSTIVTAAVLGLVAAVAENAWLPAGLSGVVALLLMAWVSHVGGQGLLAYALGHLSAAFSSLVIFMEALAAAVFGYLLFGETLGTWELLGGAGILVGIWVARPREG
ncbi:DMT family transporter [Prosthecomicrobium sp. N25]|uniref:DMT family transporter n=1 Tax=Prosthecomicrobium sp. N25 TaxID=3129254 RepID=UPI0030788168